MRCIYPYAANESTHNNEARRNAILFIQTTPLNNFETLHS